MKWILSDLAKSGPCRIDPWYKRHLRALRERGLVRPALRLHRGWEITDKGRAALDAEARK
jgi:repressor of nif and glnA expression